MINGLRFKNFKGTESSGDIEIKPITILIGPNSGGKSTIIDVLSIARETVRSTDYDNILSTSGETVDLGTYSEFVYNHDIKLPIEIDYTFAEINPPKHVIEYLSEIFTIPRDRLHPDLGLSKIRFSIKYIPNSGRIALIEKSFINSKGRSIVTISTKDNVEYYLTSDVFIDLAKIPVKGLEKGKFYELSFDYIHKRNIDPVLYKYLDGLISYFRGYSREVARYFSKQHYIGPLRDYPKRVYSATGQMPTDVGMRGENAIEVLFSDKRAPKSQRFIMEAIKEVLLKLGLAKDISLKPLSSNYFSLLLTGTTSNTPVNVRDVGFGVSQILPVLIETVYPKEGYLTLLEQPEIHLHPDVQAMFCDLLVAIATHTEKRFVVETHSDYFIACLQKNIARKHISASDVALYYCDISKTQQVRRINFADTGLTEVESDYPEYLSQGSGILRARDRAIEEASKKGPLK